MNTPIITVLSDPTHPGYLRLKKSSERNGFEVHGIEVAWQGFGTKIIELAKYLAQNPDISRFIFADAYDVIVTGNESEFDNMGHDILFSTEKNCWPVPELAIDYPETRALWKYLNSGLFFAKSKPFLDMVEENIPDYTDDDQLYYTRLYLSGKYNFYLDTHCEMFQSYSFVADDEFAYRDEGLHNLKMNTFPVLTHGNGTTDMSLLEIYV